MDRTREAHLALLPVTTLLIEHGILVANPVFDLLGGDLLGLTVAGEKAALCRIQAKFRDCTKKNFVVIPEEYVVGAFVLFMRLKTEAGTHIVRLLPDEIRKYAKAGTDYGKDIYRFTLTAESVSAMIADPELVFDAKKATKIKTLTQESSAAGVIYKEFVETSKKAVEIIRSQGTLIRLQRIIQKIAVAKAGMELTHDFQDKLNEVSSVLKRNMEELRKRKPLPPETD